MHSSIVIIQLIISYNGKKNLVYKMFDIKLTMVGKKTANEQKVLISKTDLKMQLTLF